MLDPALRKLMRLQGRGLLRRIGRGFSTPRGAAFFVVGLLIFGLWLASVGMTPTQPKHSPRTMRAVAPLLLLGICLVSAMTSAGEKAIAFTPGEVDFLFPGPFPRRQLLFYKLLKSTLAAIFTAAIMSLAMRRVGGTLGIALYVGVFLSLLFIQFLSTSLLLIGQTVSEQAFSRGRKIAVAGIVLLIVLGLRGAVGLGIGGDSFNFPALAEQLAGSETGKVLLAPFNVFGQTMTAEHLFPDLVEWAGAAVLINAALLALVVRLDGNYLEAAAGASQRRYERLRRVRGGGAMALGTKGTARRKLPQPPFLFGVGPVAWRQLTNALRSARGLLVVLLLLSAICGPFIIPSRIDGMPRVHDTAAAFLLRLGLAVAGVSVLASSMIRFDFRADLDPMESLKTLPLRPWAVCVGQLVTPVLVLSVVHWVLMLAIACTFGKTDAARQALSVMAAMVVPFNILLFAAENLVFLIFPVRPAAVGPGDFQVLGRQIFTLGLRTLLVVLGVMIALIPAIITYEQTGKSLPVLATIFCLIVLLEAIATVPLLAIAFSRFDPSRHTPAA